MYCQLLQAQDVLGKLTAFRKRLESPERRAAQLVIKRRTDVTWDEAWGDAKPRTQTESIGAPGCIDSEKLTTWTPDLLQAAYNYHYAAKDPGGYSHNPRYIMQLLYDSIDELGGSTRGMTRPTTGE